MTFKEIISGLRALQTDDFEDGPPQRLKELTDAVLKLPLPDQAVSELFAVMERFPDSDLGSPGPIVHTLERLNCREELVASIRRRPTDLAIWMVNRVLNTSLSSESRQFYLALLASVATHPSASESARCEAQRFIEFQTGKGA